MTHAQAIAEDLKEIRSEGPLIHNITNYVVMNWTANSLLAIGASPVMAHALDEVQEMVSHARALVINVGTLSRPWIESMGAAMRAARTIGVPIVFDPVGAGATRFRTESIRQLLRAAPPSVIRGNASEILSLAGQGHSTKGVDSADASDAAVEAANDLSREFGCVVCVSGEVDYVIDEDSMGLVSNGHPIMTKVTGMGCAATALIGAFAAVEPLAARAAAYAMAVMGVAGELAAAASGGPGSFQPAFLDELHRLEESTIEARLGMEFRGRSA